MVGECANGLEALDAIHALRPHLVFLDDQRPELDGFGTASNRVHQRRFMGKTAEWIGNPNTPF